MNERQRPTQEELRKAEIKKFIGASDLAEQYKDLVVNTATTLSLLSQEQIDTRAEELGLTYQTRATLPDAENEKIKNTLFRQAVTSRTMTSALSEISSGDNNRLHKQQSDKASKLAIEAVMQFGSSKSSKK